MKILKEELTILWEVQCPKCNSDILNKNGKYRGRQRFICLDCGFSFTTYSKSILDSTKLKEEQWQTIISGIIDNVKISDIAKQSGVSSISISKIRRKIFDSLKPLSRFTRTLNKHYYNPFDTSTIFVPDKDEGLLYYYKYNDYLVIAFIEYHPNVFVSMAYPIHEFNILLSSVHYPKLKLVSFKDITNHNAISYLENLTDFLKSYRGIKKELLASYCNFYDFKRNLNKEELTNLLINQLSKNTKTNSN